MSVAGGRSSDPPGPDLPELARDVPLAPLTTLGVGGPARFLARPSDLAELRAALSWARKRAQAVLILGQGSNVVFSDAGFDGLVLQLELKDVAWQESGASVRVSAGAGVTWDDLVAEAVRRDCSGIECLSGIPGRAGAAPIQNIGAYGQELADALVGVQALDSDTLAEVHLEPADCRFGYRSSFFKADPSGRRLIVLSIELELAAHGRPEIRYEELSRRLGGSVSPNPIETRAAVLTLRRAKSMLFDRGDPLSRSVGSFFVNPLLSEERLVEAEARGRCAGLLAPGQTLPRFATADGHHKVPAAWLIERAGFPRGHRQGAVGLSERHALAIVNLGGACAADVVGLARAVRDGVRRAFGIALEPEPTLVGLTMD